MIYDGKGRQEIQAEERAVILHFIDLHTHFDAQVGWESELTRVSWHGVTTALFGNCVSLLRPSSAEITFFSQYDGNHGGHRSGCARAVGEHNGEILIELGFDTDEISQLQAMRIVTKD